MTKHELRRHLRKNRNAIPAAERRQAAEHLMQIALQEKLFSRRQHIGFYIAFEAEMDLMPLLNAALWREKTAYLPVVPQRFQRQLKFSKLTPKPNWYLNRFGIREHWSPRHVRARQLDLLFVPLVGFDEYGYRLGMGGGFYDASLAYLKRRRGWRKPYLVGVGYECQKVDKVPHDPWDVPLDAVITEQRLYRFKRSQDKCS